MVKRKVNIFLYLSLVFLIGCKKDICQDFDSCKNQLIKESNEIKSKMSSRAFNKLEDLCLNKGQKDVCYYLAKYMDEGKLEKYATKYYSKACSLKHDKACFYGGLLLERLGEQKKALDHYLYGCMLSNGGESCFAIGNIFEQQKDWEGAAAFFKKSCDKGLNESCSRSARIVMYYLNKSKTFEKFYWKYFSKGCEGGDSYSCFFLGNLSKEMNKPIKAKNLFYKACLSGDIPEACDKFTELEGKLYPKIKKRVELWFDYFYKKIQEFSN